MAVRALWRTRGPGRWTLRTRLLAGMVGLLAAVSIVVGVVSVAALDSFLLGRLDDQLTAAAGRSEAYHPPRQDGDRDGGGDGEGPPFLFAPGQSEGTLAAQLSGGTVTAAGVLDRAGASHPLSTSQQSAVAGLAVDGRAHTVDLGGDLGRYRLLAAASDAGGVRVTGLPLRGVQATVYRLAFVVAAVAALGLLVAASAGAAIVRLSLRPLRRVAATASRVAELTLDRGEVALAVRVPDRDTDPRTEVGQVGAALNRMLGHVTTALNARQASETRVRRFVADASHELRTPLAAIRGYAELPRRCGTEVPPEVAHALRRVESQADRMTGLVEDLLLLARLDAGRPLVHEPVDLSRLVVDAVGDAHVAGPDHRWRLDLPDEPVTVSGDPRRLPQVVANLLANARVHTPPGTTVTVSLAVAAGTRGGVDTGDAAAAVLSVADDGPGIPAELLPTVFERFARGDASRSRAAGSTGLGLAIVAALVEAHRGTVEVSARPGRTEFTVRLPLVPAAVPPAVPAPAAASAPATVPAAAGG